MCLSYTSYKLALPEVFAFSVTWKSIVFTFYIHIIFVSKCKFVCLFLAHAHTLISFLDRNFFIFFVFCHRFQSVWENHLCLLKIVPYFHFIILKLCSFTSINIQLFVARWIDSKVLSTILLANMECLFECDRMAIDGIQNLKMNLNQSPDK